MASPWFLGALLIVGACGDDDGPRRTEVLIEVERDAVVDARMQELFVRVSSLVESDAACTRDACWDERLALEVSKEELPGRVTRFPVVPVGGDATRRFEVVVQARDADGAALVEQRAVSGFVEGRSVRLRLVLQHACIAPAPACRPDADCHGKTCLVCREGACGATGTYADDGEGNLVRELPRMDGGVTLDSGEGDGGRPPPDTDGGGDAGMMSKDAAGPDAEPPPLPPDQLTFAARVAHDPPIPSPMTLHSGDFDGDGRADLLWNHRSIVHGNVFYVAYGREDGELSIPLDRFGELASFRHPVAAPPQESWDDFSTLVGDFDGDGRDDVAWSCLVEALNTLYVAFAQEDRSVSFSERVVIDATKDWSIYTAYVGDLDGDGSADLYLNTSGEPQNYLDIARVTVDGEGDARELSARLTGERYKGFDYSDYRPIMADLDGDGDTDGLWINHGQLDQLARNARWAGLITTDPTDSAWSWTERFSGGGGNSGELINHTAHLGRLDADALLDLVWAPNAVGEDRIMPIWLSLGAGETNDTMFTDAMRYDVDVATWDWISSQSLEDSVAFDHRLADLDGDGDADLVVAYNAGTELFLAAGIVGEDGVPRFERPVQAHPDKSADWAQRTWLTGDFNGDGTQDLIWVESASAAGAPNRTWVALSR